MLGEEAKMEKALLLSGSKKTPEKAKAITEASKLGDKVADHSQKKTILENAGYTDEESDVIISSGLVSKSNPKNSYQTLRKLALPSRELLTDPTYSKILAKFPENERRAMSQAIRVLEEGGLTPAEIVKTFTTYDKNFRHVQRLGGDDSESVAILAEFIRRKKSAGMADNLIKKELDKAFGVCK